MLSREIVDCPQSSYYLLYNNQWILIWKYDAQKRTAVIKDGEIKMNLVRNNNTPTIFADMQCPAVKTVFFQNHKSLNSVIPYDFF